jgi:hypothetical protein
MRLFLGESQRILMEEWDGLVPEGPQLCRKQFYFSNDAPVGATLELRIAPTGASGHDYVTGYYKAAVPP